MKHELDQWKACRDKNLAFHRHIKREIEMRELRQQMREEKSISNLQQLNLPQEGRLNGQWS